MLYFQNLPTRVHCALSFFLIIDDRMPELERSITVDQTITNKHVTAVILYRPFQLPAFPASFKFQSSEGSEAYTVRYINCVLYVTLLHSAACRRQRRDTTSTVHQYE